MLVAKLVNLSRWGLGFGLVAFGGTAAASLATLSSRDVVHDVDAGDVAGIVAGGTIATVLFAALGVGIGAIVRNQGGAIVAALLVLYAVEPLPTFIPGIGDAVQRFGLGGLSSASGTSGFQSDVELLGRAPALLVLAAYALATLLLGAALLRRRDVTA